MPFSSPVWFCFLLGQITPDSVLDAQYDPAGATGGGDIVGDAANATQALASVWDKQWETIFSGSLYAALVGVGSVFALGTLLFFMVQVGRQMIDGDISKALPDFIWPILVITLLADNGVLLASGTQGIRGFIYEVNQQFLETTALDTNIREAFKDASAMGATEARLGSFVKPCQELTGQKQIECLKEAEAKIDDYVSKLQKDKGIKNKANWRVVQRVKRSLSDAIQTAQAPEASLGEKAKEFLFADPLSALVGSAQQAMIRGFLLSVQLAFQTLIEVALLLTALLGPLAVGGSLLPVGGKSIYAWLTALFSLGIAKLSFNIIVGITATVIVNAPETDAMVFPVFSAILAPILALGLAGGGGFAIFQSISSTGSALFTYAAGSAFLRGR